MALNPIQVKLYLDNHSFIILFYDYMEDLTLRVSVDIANENKFCLFEVYCFAANTNSNYFPTF